MKKLYIKRSISEYLIKNKWQLCTVFCMLLLGTVIGTMISVSMDFSESSAMGEYISNFVSAYNLQQIDRGSIFKFSAYNNIKTTLIIWASGLWIGLLPLNLIKVGAHGYKLGFSTALLVREFAVKGTIFAVASALPQIFVALPALIVYSIFNINFSISQRLSKSRGLSSGIKTKNYVKNLIYLVGLITLSFFLAFLDAYVIPIILKPICSIWGKY